MARKKGGSAISDSSLRLRSATRGRGRWEVGALKGAPRLALALEAALRRQEGILQVSANPISSRILIIYQPDATEAQIESLLRFCLQEIAAGKVERPPLSGGGVPPLIQILQDTLPERRQFVYPLLLSTVEHLISIFQELSLVAILNTAHGSGPRFLRLLGRRGVKTRLAVMTGIAMTLSLINLLVQTRRKRAWQKLTQSAQQRLRMRLITHIQEQDLAFFNQRSTAQLIKAVTENTARIGEFIERASDEGIQKVMNIFAASTTLATASPRLVMIVMFPLPLILFSTKYFGQRAADRYEVAGEFSNRFVKTLENSLSGVAEMKSFTAEEAELERLCDYSQHYSEASLNAIMMASLQSQFAGTLASLSFLLTTGYSGIMAVSDRISLSEHTRVVYWFPQLLRALSGLEDLIKLYHSANNAAQELLKIFESQPSIESGPVELPVASARGEVIFEHVSFGYQPEVKVLDDISFRLRSGETLAVVGPTGSGKSTLLRLLLRFYDVDEGHIYFDGREVRELNLEDLRAAISLVSQEAHLFQGTIRENVGYGRREAVEEQLHRALHYAGATSLIEHLPAGLETEVGDRGRKLSGGERQRVAVARAVLKLSGGAPVLALDEATSQLDNETEAALKKSLREATVGKTVIMIAHRLSTIRSADRILVLERGKIVEEGKHDDLIERQGLYASLWRLQNDDPLGGRLEVRLSD